jgi:RNA polymerase sigma factor (sigma-70 family)
MQLYFAGLSVALRLLSPAAWSIRRSPVVAPVVVPPAGGRPRRPALPPPSSRTGTSSWPPPCVTPAIAPTPRTWCRTRSPARSAHGRASSPGSNCRAWLFRILTNGFISGYRRRRRHNRFTHETGDDAVAAFYGEKSSDQGGNPQEALVQAGLGDEVESALAELGEDYLKVVLLADLRGARYRDIAVELGVPIGTVMSRLFRARRQLEERLRDYAAADYGIHRAA